MQVDFAVLASGWRDIAGNRAVFDIGWLGFTAARFPHPQSLYVTAQVRLSQPAAAIDRTWEFTVFDPDKKCLFETSETKPSLPDPTSSARWIVAVNAVLESVRFHTFGPHSVEVRLDGELVKNLRFSVINPAAPGLPPF